MSELTQRIDIPIDWPEEAKSRLIAEWDRANALALQLRSAQENIEWLRGQVDYHVNDKCRMNMEKTASYVELQSRLDECQNALQAAQTDRLGADEYTRDLEARLETALKWIEAVRSCSGDTWECSVCGHSEPWWTHSNADELTKDIAVERRVRGCPTEGCAMPLGHEEPCHLSAASEGQ